MVTEPILGQRPWNFTPLYTEHNALYSEVVDARGGEVTLEVKLNGMASKAYVQSALIDCGGPGCGDWSVIGLPNEGIRMNPVGDGVIGYDIFKNRGPLFYF